MCPGLKTLMNFCSGAVWPPILEISKIGSVVDETGSTRYSDVFHAVLWNLLFADIMSVRLSVTT